MDELDDILPYLVAASVGFLVGLEREWSHRGRAIVGPGTRTFAVLGLAGALAARAGTAPFAVGAAVVGVFLVLSYWQDAAEHPGFTTELAGFAIYLLGGLALEEQGLAIAIGVSIALLLISKESIHRIVREMATEQEVEDLIRFLAIAFVVLPLLPDRDIGPYGVLNPHEIWLLVVLIAAIGFGGYVSVRILGAGRGLLVAGFAGGFVSASATTGQMGRMQRADPPRRRPALAAALAASVATLVQTALVVWVAGPDLLAEIWPALAAGAVVLTLLVLVPNRSLLRRPEVVEPPAGRPFEILPALAVAGVLVVAILGSRWASDVFGEGGAVLVSGLIGFADAQSGVISAATLAQQGELPLSTAIAASGAALATNTVTKLVLAWTLGGPWFGSRFLAAIFVPSAVVAVGLTFAAV